MYFTNRSIDLLLSIHVLKVYIPRTRDSNMHRLVISISLFLSASLLFVIQPMVAKILLPVYGGTPAVWTVCMLFFQVLLLIAYGYAWIISRFGGTRIWRFIHLGVGVCSLMALPLTLTPDASTGVPEYWILKNLILQLGLPLFVIAASAPLLQHAFSQTPGKQAADPYFLYAASNVGSLLALISYPSLIERFSRISQQWLVWNIMYAVYIGLLCWILLLFSKQALVRVRERQIIIPIRRGLLWVGLSFIPCSLMLGVTLYISTDIAATPLFWIVPLALYLLSFIITFAQKPWISHAVIKRYGLFILVLPLLCFILGPNRMPVWQMILAHISSFFVLALLCHGELVRTRPPADHLTMFYFCMALGGALAGLFNGLLAPRLFNQVYEYPLVMFLAILMCIQIPKMRLAFLSVSGLTLACVLFWQTPLNILTQQRNFYGIKQVFSRSGAHVLMSQNTVHGFQVFNDNNPMDGSRAYYGAVLPVVQSLQALHRPLHAMVLGLGTGVMACQFHADDKLTLVEIDEQVIDIAKNPHLFTYLQDCPPTMHVIQDDGRLAVAHARDESYELLVMDVFNADAIPVHLLTLEAFALYQKKITPDGVILVNISNRHVRMLPVLTAAGRALDMIVLHKQQPGNNRLGQLAAEWVLLTTNETIVSHLMTESGWRFVTDSEARLWTNDYSNLVPLLKWRVG